MMPALREIADVVAENDRLRARVDGLIRANNAEVERRRDAEKDVRRLTEASRQIGKIVCDLSIRSASWRGRAERAETCIQQIIRDAAPVYDAVAEFAIKVGK